jgi:hypothetical protein
MGLDRYGFRPLDLKRLSTFPYICSIWFDYFYPLLQIIYRNKKRSEKKMNKFSLALISVLLSVSLLAGCSANGINTKSINDNRGYRPFATTAPGSMPTNFSDVPSGDWYTDKVQWGSSLGIIDGYPDLTFRPNSPITRAEVIKIIKSLADKGYLTVPATPTPTTSPVTSPVVTPTDTPTASPSPSL